MYKTASRRTGGSRLNGYARLASNRGYEKASCDEPLARQLIRLTNGVDGHVLESFTNYDLALLAVKLIDEGYTLNKCLKGFVPKVKDRLASSEQRLALSWREREVIISVIVEITARWKTYRGQAD